MCVFQADQGGQVGISLDCQWGEPMSNSVEDQAAAQRHVESQLGWYEAYCTFVFSLVKLKPLVLVILCDS